MLQFPSQCCLKIGQRCRHTAGQHVVLQLADWPTRSVTIGQRYGLAISQKWSLATGQQSGRTTGQDWPTLQALMTE